MKNKVEALKEKLQHSVSPALATPLEADGYTVNIEVLSTLIQFLETRGIDGLFVGGTTGEGILLSTAERMRLHETAVQSATVPLIIHIGANRVDTAVTLAKHAQVLGADAIAAVTPYYYTFHAQGLMHYYESIAAAAPETPLFLYDIPQMALNGISPAFLTAVQEKIPTIAGIKTSRPSMIEISQLFSVAQQPFISLAGKEALALGALSYGFDGLVSGLSTAVPEPFVRLVNAFAQSEYSAARQWQQTIDHLLTEIPAGFRIGAIKQILQERGVGVGTAVPPRPMPTAPIWPQMASILEE